MILSPTRSMCRRLGSEAWCTTPPCPALPRTTSPKSLFPPRPAGLRTVALTGLCEATFKPRSSFCPIGGLTTSCWSGKSRVSRLGGSRTSSLGKIRTCVKWRMCPKSIGTSWSPASSAHSRSGLNLTEWDQLSTAVEDVLREALRELGAQRRFTTKNYKGQVAVVTPARLWCSWLAETVLVGPAGRHDRGGVAKLLQSLMSGWREFVHGARLQLDNCSVRAKKQENKKEIELKEKQDAQLAQKEQKKEQPHCAGEGGPTSSDARPQPHSGSGGGGGWVSSVIGSGGFLRFLVVCLCLRSVQGVPTQQTWPRSHSTDLKQSD